VTCLKRVGMFKHEFVANLLLSPLEKNFEGIGSYLVKLWARVWFLVFLTHGVVCIICMSCHTLLSLL